MLGLRQLHRALRSRTFAGSALVSGSRVALLASDASLRAVQVRRRQACELIFVFALGCSRVVRRLPLRFRGQCSLLRLGGALASALPASACA
jgi:hypothetical protein